MIANAGHLFPDHAGLPDNTCQTGASFNAQMRTG